MQGVCASHMSVRKRELTKAAKNSSRRRHWLWIGATIYYEKVRCRSSPTTRRGIADRTYPVEDLRLCGWGRGCDDNRLVWRGQTI